MKRCLSPLTRCLLTACLLAAPTVVLSQDVTLLSPPARRIVLAGASDQEAAPSGNLVLTLTITPPDHLHVQSMTWPVSASKASFSLQGIDPGDKFPTYLKFSGAIIPLDDSTYRLDYSLSQTVPLTDENTTQYRDTGWQTQVEILVNTEIVLMRNNRGTYTLTISRDCPSDEA